MGKWIKDRIRSFGYAFEGIAELFRNTQNARIHACVTIIVIAAGIWLQPSAMEWCLLSLCIGGVLAAEAINSSIESLADKVSPEKDPLIKKSKDLAAGGVLLMTFAAVATGLVIFIPLLIRKIG